VGSLVKTDWEFILTVINLLWSDCVQVLKVVFDERLKKLYCSKLLSIILEMIVLLIVGLLKLDKFVSLIGNFVVMAISQVQKLIFDRFVLFSKIGVQIFPEIFLILILLNLMLSICSKSCLIRINKNIPRLLKRDWVMTVNMVDLIFQSLIDQLFPRE